MSDTTADTADKIAMLLGGGLVLLGTTVMGIVESFFSGHQLEPGGNLGDVVVHTTINPQVRAFIIALGLLVLLLYGLYRFANPRRDVG